MDILSIPLIYPFGTRLYENMHTPTNAYFTKFSSGLILVFLAFSGLLVLIPLATPASAANASGPSISVTSNNPVLSGATGISVSVKVSNPTSNQYTITGFSFVTPTGWTVTNCAFGGYLVSCNVGGGGSGATWTVSTFTVGTGAGIPPGSSDTLAFTATAATASSVSSSTTYPFTSTFATKVQDSSALNYYNGPSFSIQVIDSTTVISLAVTPGGANTQTSYTAGTAPYSVTATVSCAISTVCPTGHEAGVSVVWSDIGSGATSSNYPSKFSTSSTITTSGGLATVSYQPSQVATMTGVPTATIGTCTAGPGFCTIADANTIFTTNGPPSTMSWTFSSSNSVSGAHYITTQATTTNTNTAGTFKGASPTITVSFAISDKFGNPVSLSSAGFTGASDGYTFTITALSGGGLFDTANLPSVITCTAAAGVSTTAWTGSATACPTSGGTVPLPFAYFQSGTFGTIGSLSAAVTGTYSGSSFAGAGQSKLLITSTFSTASPTPVALATTQSVPTGVTFPNVPAGNQVNVTATLATQQAGVPVQLFLDQATSYETTAGAMDYGANSMLATGFSGSDVVSLTTNSLGAVSALFTVDTVAGSNAFFQANGTRITDTSANTMAISGDSSPAIVTVGNVPATFAINTYYSTAPLAGATTHAATSASLYVDVTIADAYGNPATNTGVNQIQISLVASCASTCPLSASTVYIPSGGSDTYGSFGAVVWTMPSTTGAVTLTASGVLGGVQTSSAPYSVDVVSPSPSIAITSPTPVNGVVYSSTVSVIFTGQANVSIGYASTGSFAVSIKSVTYKIDSGAVQKAPITSGYDITFSLAATFTPGLHSISFNTTDSAGNSVTGQTYQVLVDTSAPTVEFMTPNNANLTNGASATATIVVLQGDLNASSVTATQNGTPITASHITVSGNNALGTNTTYAVTISGLSAGTDVIGLSATTLSGLSATANSITVHVTLPANQLFSISGTAVGCSLGGFSGTCISYTNQNTTAGSVVVFAVWKNNAGQTMGVGTAGLTVASGATDEAFVPQPVGLASGTYTVNIFVVTTANIPVSLETTISVSV